MGSNDYFVHESSYVDEGAEIGEDTKIWHFSHVLSDARIGRGCNFGQNVCVGKGVRIGDNVKIQNNVSVYEGVEIEDHVFLGPSCVLTNVINPRCEITRKEYFEKTLIRKGATIGANATIVCGVTIGRFAFVAAGSVVTKDLPDYAMAMGVPAGQAGWVSRHGHRLGMPDEEGFYTCPESGLLYRENEKGALVCVDVDEDMPLPDHMKKGRGFYREFKQEGGQ